MTEKKSVVQTFREAKYLIQNNGWHQGGFSTYDAREVECFCLLGAVNKISWGAAYGEGLYKTVGMNYLTDAVQERDPECYFPAEYNDNPARTKEEILSLLDRAIELAQKDNA